MFSLSNMQQYLPSWPTSWIPSISIPSVLFTVSAMLVGTLLNEVLTIIKTVIPRKVRDKILSKLNSLIENYFSQMTLIIDAHINSLSINQMFEASEIYLCPKISSSVGRLKISKGAGDEDICVKINQGEKIMDTFQGIQLTWLMKSTPDKFDRIHRSIELTFNKKYMEKVLNCYLPHVLERSKAMKAKNKVPKLYSYGKKWISVNLDHPSTFDTLAMEPTLKEELKDDLDRFVNRREYYRTVGKAWKRGYLLYGPPGTGKSSLIAAMANHLKFHIYDLELTKVQSDSELRNLLVSTANQSILVIEDIDCSKKIPNRHSKGYNNGGKQASGKQESGNQVTLSGLLNFVDGLWSSCGDERIIIFTANHIDKLDPALLRPGRMDMHIQMSYCTPCGFKFLASKYLGIKDHSMFTEIEKLMTEVEVTPAEIAEELLKSDKADKALGGLVKFLCTKKTEHDKANAEGKKEVNEQDEESPGNKGAEKESGEK